MATTTPLEPNEALVSLSATLDQAHDVAWNCAGDQELLGSLAMVHQLRNRLDALAGKIAVAAEAGAVQRDGSRTASIWVGANTNSSPAGVRSDLRATRWLLDYPTFRDASDAGLLGRRHIDLLRNAERPVTRNALRRDEDMLAGFAHDLPFEDFAKAVQYWVNAADPDGVLPDEQLAANRVTTRRRLDGSGTINAELDPLLMTTFHEAIERELKRLRTEDTEAGVTRTTGQRRAAALAALVDRGAARTDGTKATPLINLVLGVALAEQLLASRVDPDAEITPKFDGTDYRCELIDGTPIHPKYALALLGIASMRRIVLDAKSRNTDISHNTRAFPQWMKDAALVSSRGQCTEPGCDARFHWLHADHIKPRAKGGKTRFDNLQPFCAPANYAKSDTWHPPPSEPPEPGRTDRPAA